MCVCGHLHVYLSEHQLEDRATKIYTYIRQKLLYFNSTWLENDCRAPTIIRTFLFRFRSENRIEGERIHDFSLKWPGKQHTANNYQMGKKERLGIGPERRARTTNGEKHTHTQNKRCDAMRFFFCFKITRLERSQSERKKRTHTHFHTYTPYTTKVQKLKLLLCC